MADEWDEEWDNELHQVQCPACGEWSVSIDTTTPEDRANGVKAKFDLYDIHKNDCPLAM